MSSTDISALLPPSLNLPTHLSAHKYFFVCTLTVAAWDTLVLSPRSWRLLKTKEWPVLKVIFHVLRFLMPAEFVIVGKPYLPYSALFAHFLPIPAVAFFDTKFTLDMCAKFYLFEPVTTMVLVSLCSAVHVIRVHAIYDKSRAILGGLGAVLLVQVRPPPFSYRFIYSSCYPLTERLYCAPHASAAAPMGAHAVSVALLPASQRRRRPRPPCCLSTLDLRSSDCWHCWHFVFSNRSLACRPSA